MPTPIDRQELQRLLAEQQAQLVEVLPAAEYEDEHLPGAINIPLKELDDETTRRLERARPVVGSAGGKHASAPAVGDVQSGGRRRRYEGTQHEDRAWLDRSFRQRAHDLQVLYDEILAYAVTRDRGETPLAPDGQNRGHFTGTCCFWGRGWGKTWVRS